MGTTKFHIARKNLASTTSNGIAGFTLGVQIAKTLTRIAVHGRTGSHDDSDECGCGQCCSMLARGIVAHMEGVVASEASPATASLFDRKMRGPS